MKLSAPKQVSWVIAFILLIAGIAGFLADIPIISEFHFWIVVIGLVLMLLSTYLKKL